MSEQLYSMRAQGIGKADCTFASFTKSMIEDAKEKARKEGFIFFNISENAATPPEHDYDFEKNIEPALKLREIIKERIKQIGKDFDYNNPEHTQMGIFGVALQSMVEKSEE